MNRTTLNLIALALLLVGVSATDGCSSFNPRFNCGGSRGPPPSWLADGQKTFDPTFIAADHWIRDAEAVQAKADTLDPGERERYLRKKARAAIRWTKRRNGGKLPWHRPPSKNADGLWTVKLPDGQWVVRKADGHWNARLKPKPRVRKGPRRWTLKNNSQAPLKVTYTTEGTLKSKTLKPGKTLKLTTDSDGISYTLRQGERKKKGTAIPRRGQKVTTTWE